MIYTKETIDFLKDLPEHTKKGRWPKPFLKRYQQFLRDPTRDFAAAIQDQFVRKLSREVRYGICHPTNKGHGYKDHYVFAFFDPAAGKWYKSVQLFFYLDSGGQSWSYGFSVWPDVSKRHLAKFNAALEKSAAPMSEYFRRAPTATRVRIDCDGGELDLLPADFAARLAPTRAGRRRPLGACYGITAKREYRLRSLTSPAHAGRLVEEVGEFFAWAWPLFEAGRTGRWSAR